jgi:hypothetical protein
MFTMKTRKLAATLGLTAFALAASSGLGIAAPAAHASAAAAGQCNPEFNFECATFSSGQHLRVLYGNSPLRGCPDTNCGAITYMPATTSYNPGGGWVTSEANQNASNAWCIINYRGITGWTGCWRLSA